VSVELRWLLTTWRDFVSHFTTKKTYSEMSVRFTVEPGEPE